MSRFEPARVSVQRLMPSECNYVVTTVSLAFNFCMVPSSRELSVCLEIERKANSVRLTPERLLGGVFRFRYSRPRKPATSIMA